MLLSSLYSFFNNMIQIPVSYFCLNMRYDYLENGGFPTHERNIDCEKYSTSMQSFFCEKKKLIWIWHAIYGSRLSRNQILFDKY